MFVSPLMLRTYLFLL